MGDSIDRQRSSASRNALAGRIEVAAGGDGGGFAEGVVIAKWVLGGVAPGERGGAG
jgi:hypothetical protein